MTTAIDCRFCIDAIMPAGRDTAMGELFERCPACTPPCTGCDGIAVFPAIHDTPYRLLVALLPQRLAPIFCPGCLGVISLIDLDPTEDQT
jgi:hypothetical protein